MASEPKQKSLTEEEVNEEENFQTTPPIEKTTSDRLSSAQHLTFLNVKMPDDEFECSVRDIVCLSDKKILVADNSNRCFKVFNEAFQLVMRKNIGSPDSSQVRSLASFGSDDFAAILDNGNEDYINFYRVDNDGIKPIRKMRAHAVPLGISIGHRQQVAVTCKKIDDPELFLRVLDWHSTFDVMTHEITSYDKGDKKLSISQYHEFSPTEDKIYLSDTKNVKVVCIDLSGEILWEVFFQRFLPGFMFQAGGELIVAVKSLWGLFAIEIQNGRRVRWFMNRKQLPNRPNIIRIDQQSTSSQRRFFVYRDDYFSNYIDVFQISN